MSSSSPTTVADGSSGAPGRMAVSIAVSFICFRVALLVSDSPWKFGIAQTLAGGAGFLALLNFVGFFFGVDAFEGIASYTKMSLHTSACFLALCLGFYFGAALLRRHDGRLR